MLLAFGLVAGWPGSRTMSGLFGLGLVAWIAVRWALLDDRLWLQPAMFVVGVVIAVLALRGLRRSQAS